MLYILSEITFQFYFWRYKIVTYTHRICFSSYGFKFFTPSPPFFKPFLTHYTSLYTSNVFFPPLPSSHLLVHVTAIWGRYQIISNFLPVKLLWKISYSYMRVINSFRKKHQSWCVQVILNGRFFKDSLKETNSWYFFEFSNPILIEVIPILNNRRLMFLSFLSISVLHCCCKV